MLVRAGTKAGKRACSGNRRSRFACRRMGLPLHGRGGTAVWPAQETTVQKHEQFAERPKVFLKTFGRPTGNVYFCSTVAKNP